MKRIFSALVLLCALTGFAHAQVAPFGQVDTADLKLTKCDFEANADAMVLFQAAKVYYNRAEGVVMEVRRRVKVLSLAGTKQGSIRLDYISAESLENIKDIQAVTVNWVNNKIESTPLDPKLIFAQKVDKQHKTYILTLANVKAGSVIDLSYTWQTPFSYHFPDWFFQEEIPTRYSEFDATVNYAYHFNVIKKSTQPLAVDTAYLIPKVGIKRLWVMKNVPSFRIEAYMGAVEDNLQGVYFHPAVTFRSWRTIGANMLDDPDYGGQFKKTLKGEQDIVRNAKEIKSREDRIAYIFNTVKNTVKWNEVDQWYTDDGIQQAWTRKRGNSTEINLIIYHLLTACDIAPTLMTFGTRDHGEIEYNNPSYSRLNKTVVRVPIDSAQYYVLDATGKYNTFNNTPYDLLGINMLAIDPVKKTVEVVKLNTALPSAEMIMIRGAIKADGKLEGSLQVSNSNYKRTSKLAFYDRAGEKAYLENIKGGNNSLKLSDLHFSDLESDTLPMREDLSFKMDLPGSDDNYIFFSPNIFTGIGENPFISETRLSDVDMIYPTVYSINGNYTVPAGYKIDALPKPITIVTPDKGISFKRNIGESNGAVAVNYTIIIKKTRYKRDEYPDLRLFYKTMFEMLNEQVVLKKG